MKVWNYIFIMVGISILFELSGILGSDGVLTAIGYSRVGEQIFFDFSVSSFLTNILGVLAGAIAGGIIVGFFTRSSPENYILLGLVTGGTLTLFVQTIYGIIQASLSTEPWIASIVILIAGPLLVGFMLSLAEFFRGTD